MLLFILYLYNKSMIGDIAVQDLTPKTTNLGDRLVKNLRICGSGVYTYHKSEISLLNLGDTPSQYKDLEYINVYRSPDVLVANKDKFARVPIITGSHVLVNQQNAKNLCVGMIGDTVTAEKSDTDGETYLYTTGTIVAGDGVAAYENYGELSVGYDPIMSWLPSPIEYKGKQCQVALEGFNDVNHILICKTARGGHQCMIMDSTTPLRRFIIEHSGGKKMNIFSKIFGTKQKINGDSVSLLLDSIALGADPEKTVEKIRSIAGDAINEEMDGFLKELSLAKDAEPSELNEAVQIVKGKWEVMSDSEKPADEKPAGEKPADSNSEEAGDEEHPADCDCEECKTKKEQEKKSAGDSLDYDLIANKVAEILKPKENTSEELARQQVVINGDSASGKSSDEFMKDIWG